MLNLISVAIEGADRRGVQRAVESARRQGFLSATSLEWEGGSLTGWSHPSEQETENCEVCSHAGVACCVGPIWYRGRFGRSALLLILEDTDANGCVDEACVRGNHALFIRTRDRCMLMNDALGFVRVYVSADRCFYSTSWLATCAYTGGVELDEAASIEYVLLGASHSDSSVARGVTTLPLGYAFDLSKKNTQGRLAGDPWGGETSPASLGGAVEEISAYLKTASRELAAAFPGRVRAALSGGFDSRLIVAGLLACGSRPELFVYGAPESVDVTIAGAVAAGVGLPVQHVDKQAMDRDLPFPDLERLVDSALFFDGLPNDGVHDPGPDQQTRLAQTAGSRIALNGGGGEIFRNYFHLQDRPYHAVDVVRAFYRGFDGNAFRHRHGLRLYQERMVSSIECCLGLAGADLNPKLTRGQVELLYPLFRCHFWMGVNNSVGVRHGYYMTPLVDLNTIRLAWSLPLRWKNAGLLESHIIAKLHTELASQPSSYGFRFTERPTWDARFSEWATRMRPVRVRPYINAWHRRFGKSGVPAEMALRCRALLPGEWRLDQILDLNRLPSSEAFARALAIEVVWRELVA